MTEINTIAYTENLGAYSMPEGAEKLLSALSIEEQVKLFEIEVTSTEHPPYKNALTNSRDAKSLIVKDGIIVGIMISDSYGISSPCFIGQSICTWNASDNNGAGYNSRKDISKLLFVPGNN